jgi:hypothetical protein
LNELPKYLGLARDDRIGGADGIEPTSTIDLD